MLDVLEAGMEALRSNGTHAPAGERGPAVPAEQLREEMNSGSLSPGELANALNLPRRTVEEWLEGRAAAPSWVPATIRLVALLTPSARRKLQNGAARKPEPETERSHPFSRIEDL